MHVPRALEQHSGELAPAVEMFQDRRNFEIKRIDFAADGSQFVWAPAKCGQVGLQRFRRGRR
jgi:hypothetical protein